MSARTVKQTQVLQKILTYFEVAAKVGEDVPDTHVQQISTLVDDLLSQLVIPTVTKIEEAQQPTVTVSNPATTAPQPATPAPPAPEPAPPAPVVQEAPMPVISREQYLAAMFEAAQTPGLSWQQNAAMQAGLPFSTTTIAKEAITAANNGTHPAPSGLAPIPTPEELKEAVAGALL